MNQKIFRNLIRENPWLNFLFICSALVLADPEDCS